MAELPVVHTTLVQAIRQLGDTACAEQPQPQVVVLGRRGILPIPARRPQHACRAMTEPCVRQQVSGISSRIWRRDGDILLAPDGAHPLVVDRAGRPRRCSRPRAPTTPTSVLRRETPPGPAAARAATRRPSRGVRRAAPRHVESDRQRRRHPDATGRDDPKPRRATLPSSSGVPSVLPSSSARISKSVQRLPRQAPRAPPAATASRCARASGR